MHSKYFKGYLQRAAAIGLSALLLTACQPTPDTEAIVQKEDINKVVEKYADDGYDAGAGAAPSSDSVDDPGAGDKDVSGDTGSDGTSGTAAAALRQSIGAPEATSFSVPISNVGAGTTTIAAENVPVILPDVDKLGSAAVVRSDLSAEQVKAIAEKFLDGRTAYELGPDTKEDYMKQIQSQQEAYQDYLNQGMTEEELEGLQEMIDELQQKMANAPAKADVVLQPTVFEWKAFEGVPGLESIYGKSDENGISYTVSAQREASFFMLSLSKYEENLKNHDFISKENLLGSQAEGGISTQTIKNVFAQQSCKYTESQAVDLCLQFLQDEGIDTTALATASIIPFVQYDYETGEFTGDGVGAYEIILTHGVGGVAQTWTNNDIRYVSSEENDGKVAYDYECMRLNVDDTGVTSFYWQNPMAMGETLADKVSLKPYEEIEEIICQHIGLAYENYSMDERLRNGESLDVDRITLGMMRIQNQNDESNYTLIPVWDVFSKQLGSYSLVTVNAMDGSIIVRENGY